MRADFRSSAACAASRSPRAASSRASAVSRIGASASGGCHPSRSIVLPRSSASAAPASRGPRAPRTSDQSAVDSESTSAVAGGIGGGGGPIEMALGCREVVPEQMRPAERELGADERRTGREPAELCVLDRVGRQLDRPTQAAAAGLEQRQLAEHARRHRPQSGAAGQLERRSEQRIRLVQLPARGLRRSEMGERACALGCRAGRRVEPAAGRCFGQLGRRSPRGARSRRRAARVPHRPGGGARARRRRRSTASRVLARRGQPPLGLLPVSAREARECAEQAEAGTTLGRLRARAGRARRARRRSSSKATTCHASAAISSARSQSPPASASRNAGTGSCAVQCQRALSRCSRPRSCGRVRRSCARRNSSSSPW